MNKHQGFSLVELIVSMVVIGIALPVLSQHIFRTSEHASDSFFQAKSTLLAQAYLDEILAMRYQEDSPIGGGSVGSCSISNNDSGELMRSLYDDVDDYHGIDESGRFLDTTTTSRYQDYRVKISISCVGVSHQPSVNSKHILITITGPENTSLNFSVFRGDF